MGQPKLMVLNQDEMEALHGTALRILAEVGMVVPSADAMAILTRAGARAQGERVCLPGALIEEVLQAESPPLHLADRRSGALRFPAETHAHVSGSNNLGVLDFATQQIRTPTWEDVARFTRLADALPLIAALSPQLTRVVSVDEGSPDVVVLRILGEVVCNTTKHCMLAPLNGWLAKRWIEIGEILAGARSLASYPVISVIVSPNTPLSWDRDSLSTVLLAARKGLPIGIASMGMAGMSTPITIAGSLALVTAQALFGLTLAASEPSRTSDLGAAGDEIMDMRTVQLALAGPEDALGMVAGGQMAHRYGLPSMSCAPHTDSKHSDPQVGMEKMAGMLSTVAAGIEMSINAGSLNKSSIASYEQMMIDHELLRFVYRYLAGIGVTEETLAYDAIAAVGPGGSFLDAGHTLRHLRSGENVYFALLDRCGPNERVAPILERAHEEAEAILARHTAAVPTETVEAITAYVAEQSRGA